jgi:protein tyrosine phosphatase (PTP) superfamily phosphohydrolase (DUF442 family)
LKVPLLLICQIAFVEAARNKRYHAVMLTALQRHLGCLLPLLVLAVGCSIEETPPQRATTNRRPITRLPTKYLPNAVRLHKRVISGGLPEGDAGFAELRDLGIKTIISVDGAKPDVAAAEKYGLRYVHLPHGYDGISKQRAKELAKAVHELPAPIYIHCHHGHHRSPAAAAVACVGAGLIAPTDAALVLQIAGTSEQYRGLFQSAQSARALDQALLAELACEFPATAKLPPLAEAMVMVEQTHDHLKSLQRAGWQTPPDQPALLAEHEALLLREHFTELLRTSEVQRRPEPFRRLMHDGEELARELETALRDHPQNGAAATKHLARINDSCVSCHQKFRDTPLQEVAVPVGQ